MKMKSKAKANMYIFNSRSLYFLAPSNSEKHFGALPEMLEVVIISSASRIETFVCFLFFYAICLSLRPYSPPS